MKATIWHNPNCGTSRKTLVQLQESDGIELTVIEYLKTPFTAEKLTELFQNAGVSAAEALRMRGNDAVERGLPDADEATIIAAMAENSAYVERPFVETEKGVRLCRPQERLNEIL